MAKEKKRGLFSWLGFGQKEEPQEAAPEQKMESQAVVEEQAPVEEHIAVEEHTPVEAEPHSLIESEAFAADVVDVTEKVIEREEQQADIIAEEAVVVEPEMVTEPEAVAEPDVITEPEVVVEHEELLVPEEIEAVEPEPEAWLPEEDTVVADDEPEQQPQPDAIVEQEKPTKEGFFARLKRSLLKTKENLGSGFISLFRGKKIDDDLFEELEEQLLIADVGVETTRKIITNLTEGASRKQLRDAEALYGLLKDEMGDILAKVDEPLNIEGKTPFVILMVGVNGVGKTTTIGKLARQFEQQGKSVMLAAGDTFRAAAVEQLQVWGQRNNIPVIAQHTGADSASVIFDAIQAAKSRKVDVLIADTAGRLQNKAHLMEELKKIVRVMKKLDVDAPHEVMLTIDASTGQNAVSQARLFHEAVGLTGITLTKLDGTAKGGVIFSVADQFGIPIRYIGTGERIEDLRPFNAGDFIEALFARED
ncbi:signal recognition particle-docking protein FtsY [Enterobacter kobei]|uniref:Signal recognition particle receptor FtsY n=2 Tax=Enterobacter kobei TaxID=208224 RepID=A0AA86IKU3_9ENTR|nr:signal recognition particle-docking protein FtsY [Enterobacter kobei]OLR18892.1 signal recognition particle-docking protein FtsY [Enterobacter kobei]BCU53675.1 signal recognition particle receptor FtsY [Enterobacter kobei]SIR38425.1 signal recognition particle-docking protein FtsY [Enterobacter kobei]